VLEGSKNLVVYYLYHGLAAAFWISWFMTVMRVCAVATFAVSFSFFAAFFALKHWHGSSQQNTTANDNNFAREGLHIKVAFGMIFNGVETHQRRSKSIL
jgi:biopolymer transport protein ExbB/TolQ